ncbi:MAG: flippase [Gemmatimonadales bacterium]
MSEQTVAGPTPSPKLPLANFAALASGELASRAVGFAVTAMLTRRLGADGFGELAFAVAVAGYVLLVPVLSLQEFGSREVSRSPTQASHAIASVTLVRLLVAMCGVGVLALFAVLMPMAPHLKWLIVISGLAMVPTALNAGWGYKALEQTARPGASLVLLQVVSFVGVFTMVHGPGDLLRVPVIQAVGEVAAAALLLPLLWQGWPTASLKAGIALVRGASPMVVNRLLRAIVVAADVVMLGVLTESAQVGLYSAAYRVCFLLTAIAASAHIVFQPALMRAHDDAPRASKVLTDSTLVAGALGLPLVAGGIIVAPDLLGFLFSAPFRDATAAFRLLLLAMGMLFLHGTMNSAFLARHRLGAQTAVIGAAAFLNVVLNAVLIPTWGILGASLATVAAEGLILVGSVVVLRGWNWQIDYRVLAKPAFAASAMALLLLALPGWHVMIRIIGGAVTYVGVLMLIGGVPDQLIPGCPRAWRRA